MVQGSGPAAVIGKLATSWSLPVDDALRPAQVIYALLGWDNRTDRYCLRFVGWVWRGPEKYQTDFNRF